MADCLIKFAVVIPMYNEAVGAGDCVDAVCKELSKGCVFAKLIVVEDGSRDNTKEVLQGLQSHYEQLEIFYHEENKGYGAALRTGVGVAEQGGYQYVLFMDSDLTNDPRDIKRFAEEMAKGVDVIKATRYCDGGGVKDVPSYRVIISKVGNLVARILFRLPLSDCTNGFRAIKTDLLTKVELKENNFSIIMEELYRLKPIASSYANVPVVLTNRADHLRCTSFSYRVSIFWDYLKYPLMDFFRLRFID